MLRCTRALVLTVAVSWWASCAAQPPPVALETGLGAADPDPSAGRPPLGLRALPLPSRTDLIPYLQVNVPGMIADGAGLSIHGGAEHENRYTVDGMGVSRLRVPLTLLGDLQVARAGYGAALGDVTGGLVAVETRAPGTRWQAGVDAAQELGDPDGQVVSVWAGGPVVGQRLLLVTALEVERTDRKGVEDYQYLAGTTNPIERRGGKGALRLAFLPSADHRVELLAIGSLGRQDNDLRLSSTVVRTGEAQPRLEERYGSIGLRWLGRLGARVQAQAQVGAERVDDRETPLICVTRSDCENRNQVDFRSPSDPQVVASTFAPRTRVLERNLEANASVLAELPALSSLQTSVRVGTRVRLQSMSSTWSVPGNTLVRVTGMFLQSQTTWLAGDPRQGTAQPGGSYRHGDGVQAIQFVEASGRVGQWLEVRPGLGLVHARASVEGQRLGTVALTPHLSVAGLLHAGRQLGVRASTHRRVDADVGQFVDLLLPEPWSETCDLTGATPNCRFSGGGLGVTHGLPCGSLGIAQDGSRCRRETTAPRVWEHTLGAGGLLVWGIRLDVDVVERRTHGLWTSTETNRIWTVVGRSASFTGDYRNGTPELVTDLSPSAGEGRRHRAVTTSLTRGTGDVAFALAHTYSRTREQTQPLVGMVIDEDDNGRHFLHLQGAWKVMNRASLGAVFAYAQGLPYARLVRSSLTGEYLPYGTPAGNLDSRLRRLPSVKQVSVQARLSLRTLLGVDAQVYGDFVNVLSARQYKLVRQEDGLLFGTIVGVVDDRFVRLGLQAGF